VWRFISSFFSLFPHLWSALTGKRSTVRYPDEPLIMPPGYRGRLAVVPVRCKGCGLCVRDCPAAALELIKESKQKFKVIYYPNRCAFCGQCELSCHADALRLTNDYVQAAFDAASFEVTLIDHDEEEENSSQPDKSG
jgi:formate hydrogenlyase subunit 6/NADH:ubiquinone oxidoreductase subunit I